MSFQNIVVATEANIATVMLSRPEKLNALDHRTLEELEACFSELKNDSGVAAVILTGAGEKAFAAGADISEINALDQQGGEAFAAFGQKVFRQIETLGKPVIAAINGFALGGGCELAMACHIRLAAENAKFGQPEVNLGLIAGYGGTQRLPRLVGLSNANYILLSGNIVNAERALAIGLVSEVLPIEELLPAAAKLANEIAGKAPVSVRHTLSAIYEGYHQDWDSAMATEAVYFGRACNSEDMKEGTTAFLEKRKPEFKGH